jgi:hypothetical protein
MYLLSQLVTYLFITFALGVGAGYALWRIWGEREMVAKFNAAEMRLAAHMARWEKTVAQAEAAGRHSGEAERPRPAAVQEKAG